MRAQGAVGDASQPPARSDSSWSAHEVAEGHDGAVDDLSIGVGEELSSDESQQAARVRSKSPKVPPRQEHRVAKDRRQHQASCRPPGWRSWRESSSVKASARSEWQHLLEGDSSECDLPELTNTLHAPASQSIDNLQSERRGFSTSIERASCESAHLSGLILDQ